jgi:hypothetical protein
MEPGLHWLQLETVAYLVGQLKRVGCLSVRLWPKRGGIPLQKGFVEVGNSVLMHSFGVHFC